MEDASTTPEQRPQGAPQPRTRRPRAKRPRPRVPTLAEAPDLPGADARTRQARRFRQVYAALCGQLVEGRRPPERRVPPATGALLVAAASAILSNEALTARLANGDEVDATELRRSAYAVQHALRALGLKP